MPPIDVEPDIRSTGAYPPAQVVNPKMNDNADDLNKSTMAYPLEAEPKTSFVEIEGDPTRSTMAYPMYDNIEDAKAAAKGRGVTVEAGAAENPPYPTPGPQSSGLDDARIAKQRAELGLSDDPTGESDRGYEARPSTTPVPGADGEDHSAEYAGVVVDGRPDDAHPGEAIGSAEPPTGDETPLDDQGDVDDQGAPADADAKVVAPPTRRRRTTTTTADTK